MTEQSPNVVYIFADEWRAQATGYNGDVNCETPVLDRLAGESVDVSLALSGNPVCCPYRAGLMTGQYPLRHGVIINDVELAPNCYSIARAFKAGGYETAYIGKWHLYGSPDGQYCRRKKPVPRNYQLGFDDWYGYECCHDYWNSPYYHNDDPEKHMWEGYDAFAQSYAAADYIRARKKSDQPYMLMLSWGPPHFPLHTAPEEYRARYAQREIKLSPNVPPDKKAEAIEELRGYYAHIAALDDALKTVLDAIDESDRDNTLLVVTSDHGDMSWSQGLPYKLYPFEESVRVPFLLRYPVLFGNEPQKMPVPMDAPDVMPTLLGLCDLTVPESVQGRDWSPVLRGEATLDEDDAGYLSIYVPTTWMCTYGLPPYRGLRNSRYTYVVTEQGPWLLFDNEADPYQMHNLVNDHEHREVRERLHVLLCERMRKLDDSFMSNEYYVERFGLESYRERLWPVKEPWIYPWCTEEKSQTKGK